MLNRVLGGILVLGLSFIVIGCAHQQKYPEGKYWTDLVGASYYLADTLERNLSEAISPAEPLMVASFVNVDRLQESSTTGRILAEQVASRFVQNGYRVKEIKLRQASVFVRQEKGEFLLSRDLKEIGRTHQATNVIVGTYAQGYNRVYVSAKVVRTDDSVVVAAADCGIFIDPYRMESLVKSN